ncbi:MAG: endopeptidase La [Bacilli bacterium]|nr:endopeptidase La [Bacilli bacterium]
MENTNLNIMRLPAIAIEEFVPFPNSETRMDLVSNDAIEGLKLAEQYQNTIVVLVANKEAKTQDVLENYHPVGVMAKVLLNMSMPGNTRRIKIRFDERVLVKEVIAEKPGLLIEVETNVSSKGEEELIEPTFNLIKKELTLDVNRIPVDNKELINRVTQETDPERLCDLLSSILKIPYVKKVKCLNELTLSGRLKLILEELNLQKFYNEIEAKIDNDVKQSINESQKEYYLREKIKAIQAELGESAKKEEDIENLRKKILESGMPKEVEEVAMKELNRYRSSSFNSAESGIIRTYLDFIVSLPWNQETQDTDDIINAKNELDKDHYGLDKVKERILEYLAVKILNKKNPQSILCLVGPPGVGKTSLARSIAKALNKSFVKESLGGVRDEAEIRGHRRTYIGALPGRILQSLQKAKSKNPVFLLDEIDKMSSDYKGDPTSALLEVLDPEQNRYFSDHYLEVPFDLSKVMFICTANYIGYIPAPLRDRMEIVEVSSYTEYEKFEIAKRHLIPKQLKLHGIDNDRLQISDQAIYTIIQNYTRETGVRELERLIGSITRKVIKKILMEKIDKITVDTDTVNELLGKVKYVNNKIDDEDKIGVVTGLAYTEYGGDTLDVEVTYYKGGGHLVLTGKLGEVMKESAQAALSYVKSNAIKFDIDPEIFNGNDIHIHVPEGAIPKDGPSAGVTITTAIVSALSNHKVHHDLGMTGEITLRGRVLPIGGLKEKSIAAHRSGLNTILIPFENTKDIDDIPDSVKSALKIIPVKTIEEVIEHAIIK